MGRISTCLVTLGVCLFAMPLLAGGGGGGGGVTAVTVAAPGVWLLGAVQVLVVLVAWHRQR